jgi:hypothetical protein
MLGGERSRREQLDAEAARLRDELGASHVSLKASQARVLELETRVGVLRQLLSAPVGPLAPGNPKPSADTTSQLEP